MSSSEFLKAARDGDIAKLRSLPIPDQNTFDQALQLAASKGNYDEAKFLIERGANPRTNDNAALQWAAYNNYPEVVDLLLKNGANIQANNYMTIQKAAENNNQKVLDVIKTNVSYYPDITGMSGQEQSSIIKYIDNALEVLPRTLYLIHDNGGRPYQVEVDNNAVRVYPITDNGYSAISIYGVNAEKVFIGDSIKNEMTEYSGGYGPDFDGNSILVKVVGNNQYVWIGNRGIQQFQTKAPIVEYVSPVGNSDVPYPFAKDVNGNYYLLFVDTMVKNLPSKYISDPNDFYFDNHIIIGNEYESGHPEILKQLGYDIDMYLTGDEVFNLTYKPDAAAEYDDIVNVRFKAPMYFVDSAGNKHQVTKQEYVNLMNAYGNVFGMEGIHFTTIRKRD